MARRLLSEATGTQRYRECLIRPCSRRCPPRASAVSPADRILVYPASKERRHRSAEAAGKKKEKKKENAFELEMCVHILCPHLWT